MVVVVVAGTDQLLVVLVVVAGNYGGSRRSRHCRAATSELARLFFGESTATKLELIVTDFTTASHTVFSIY